MFVLRFLRGLSAVVLVIAVFVLMTYDLCSTVRDTAFVKSFVIAREHEQSRILLSGERLPVAVQKPALVARTTMVVALQKVEGHARVGAGVVVGHSGRNVIIVTAKHVVTGARRVVVVTRDQGFWPFLPHGRARVYASAEHDLALVVLPAADLGTVATATTRAHEVPRGEKLVIVGHPNQSVWRASPGIAYDVRGEDLFMVCRSCGPGDSGGGVFDSHGKLAGILTAQVLFSDKRHPHVFLAEDAETTAEFVRRTRAAQHL